jgi:cytochrome c oxidase subunit IV
MASEHEGTLKRSIEWFLRTGLRPRLIVALILVAAGIVAAFVSALSLMANSPTLNWVLGVVLGAVLILVGLALLVTELMETWLTRGQKALVDGLQAG